MDKAHLPESPIKKVPLAAVNHDNRVRPRTIELALFKG